MAFFMVFVVIMGLTFVNLLRDYHKTQYGGGGGGAAAMVRQDPSVAKTTATTTTTTTMQVGTTEMAEALHRQIQETMATTITAHQEQLPKGEQDEPISATTKTAEPTEAKNSQRLNVALFYADDWTMKVLGKLDKHVKTPNIDKMADNGMMFTNNCVTTSVCWASRSTLATGTYTAVHKHTMPFTEAEFETEHWEKTMYPLMKSSENGNYYTGLFGKWHKLEVDKELKSAFNERKIYYSRHWEERNGVMRHVTELTKSDSLEFLDNWEKRRKQEGWTKPFFLTSAFFATHARDGEFPSYQPTNETRFSTYPDNVEIPKAKTATKKHWNDLPSFLRQNGNEGRTRWRRRFDPENFQVSIKDMYAMATEVDEAIGAIIKKITHLGVYDKTVLIFTTDNGNMHGEHGLAEKWYPFEESIRVPLVIQDPRMPEERRGTISEAWTLNVDLTPTILGAANLPPSDFMQGRNIADLYLNKVDGQAGLTNSEMIQNIDWRKDWFYEFNLGTKDDGSDHPWKKFIDASFALVTDEWKYVVWPQHNYEQLFHRSVDPFDEWDLLNKINRPDMMEVEVNENGETIKKTVPIDTSNDNGPFKDTVQTTVKIYNEMKARYEVLKKKAQSGERI